MAERSAIFVYLTLVNSIALLDDIPPDVSAAVTRAWARLTAEERAEVGRILNQRTSRSRPVLRVIHGGKHRP